MIYNNIEELIGNTPLLKIDPASHGLKHIDVYAKLEYSNPFGSIKDRTALGLTQQLDFEKLKQQGTRLVESSSGNTAKALQIIAARHDNQLVSVTNRVKVPEVEQILRYLGVEVVALPGRSECPDPNDDDSALAQIARLERDNPGAYHHTSQFTNPANPQIHAVTTAAELYQDLERIDYVVSGVGTGGSSGGIIEYIRQHQLPTKSIGVVSDTSDFLPGIRTEAELFETGLFNRQWFEALVQVSSGDALAALDQLVRRNGVLAGPTTGACFAALRSHLADHDTLRPDGSRQTAVFIACDRLEPYMSYISKRLPERFGQRRHTDIFDLAVGLEESDACQKTADQATWQWLLQQSATLVDTRGVKPFD